MANPRAQFLTTGLQKAGDFVESKLDKFADEFPEEATIEASRLPAAMAKKQVKDEELNFSGVGDLLPKSGRLNKKQVKDLVSKRKDKFGAEESSTSYKRVTVAGRESNPTYRAKVYTFKNTPETAEAIDFANSLDDIYDTMREDVSFGAAMARDLGYDGPDDMVALESWLEEAAEMAPTSSRYISDHFPETEDYLVHTRTLTDNIDGKHTHVVMEVQSDLHQQAKTTGYASQDGAEGIPKSPYENSWLKKTLEKEIVEALSNGSDQVAVPIKGPGLESLARGAGVQGWYETQVSATVRKLAKANGFEFKEVTDEVGDAAAVLQRISENSNSLAASASPATKVKGEQAQDIVNRINNKELHISTAISLLDEIGLPRWAEQLKNVHETVQYAVIDMSKGKEAFMKPGGKRFSLYAAPAIPVVSASQALHDGFTEVEVREKLSESFEEEDVDDIMHQAKTGQQVLADGYSPDELRSFLTAKEEGIPVAKASQIETDIEPPAEGTNYGDLYRKLTGNEDMDVQEFIGKMEALSPHKSYLSTAIAGFAGSENAKRQLEETSKLSNAYVQNLAKERGLDLTFKDGETFATMPDGSSVAVTPEWWRGLAEGKFEVGGSMVGGVYGGLLGKAVSVAAVHPLAKLAVVAGTSVLGAFVGSQAGSATDYLHQAVTLNEELNAEVLWAKQATAAEASLVGDLVGNGIFIVGKHSFKGLVKAKDFIKNNSTGKAREALKEHMFISDAEADELVVKLSKVVSGDVPAKSSLLGKVNKGDQEISATVLTRPGAEGIVQASSSIDPKASSAIAHAIDVRAQDLLKAADAVSGEDVGSLLRNELAAYTSRVKEDYGIVKAKPATMPRFNQFKFNYDDLAINPVLERLSKNIENKDLAYKFAKQAEKIRNMSSTRSFTDLLELRSFVNEYKFNKRISSAKDFDMLNGILDNIDGAIVKGANVIMDEPKAWLKEFGDAKSAYSEMKKLEKNMIVRVSQRPGVSEKAIAQSIVKYAGATDDTFSAVLAQLPKQTRIKVEGEVIGQLTEKFTLGAEGAQRAVNFPALAKELRTVTFTSPETRMLKKAIMQLSDVFQNDVPLAQVTGNIQLPKFQSYLTTDPVVRAKFEIASGIFNRIRTLVPGSQARAQALVKTTAKLLENPLHSKSIQELVKELEGEVNIEEALMDLATKAAKKNAEGAPDTARVVLYGDKRVLTPKGKGAKHAIPLHRIATLEQVKEIVEAAGIQAGDKRAIDQALIDRGYKAAQLGADSVRLID